MRNSCFFKGICALIVSTVLSVFPVSCSKKDTSPVSPVPLTEKVTIYPAPERKSLPAVWDTADTDISCIEKTRKLIAFTFDDAPNTTLENILAVFAAYNEDNPDCPATGTLFCNGHFFNDHSEQTLHAAYVLGFELGNHTYSHFDLTKLSSETVSREIDSTDKFLARIDGKRRHLFRAPFGNVNEQIKSAIDTPVINWTIDTLDWTGVSENDIYNTVWKNKFSGAIVLMHDGYPHTVSALKRLLPDLKAAGYQSVTVSQMAKVHECDLKIGGEYIRIRKNGIS